MNISEILRGIKRIVHGRLIYDPRTHVALF